MRKITTIFVLALVMLLLAACGMFGSNEPDPTPEPVEEPTEEPMEEPTEEPMEEPTEEPMEEPTEAPAEEPTEEVMEEATEEPAEEAVEEPAEEAPAEDAAAAPVPPGLIGQQTERLRALDFSPFEEAMANFGEDRATAVEAIVLDGTILDVQAALDAGELTSEELTLFFLSRIQQYDEGLRSYTEINPNALDEARAADELRAGGTVLGPLHGIPVNLKDNIGTAAPMHTTGGAEILLDYSPAEDAPIVTQLRQAGVVILGKANLSELAGGDLLFPAGYTAVAGQTINPHGAEHSTLGSSSGSGASTAALLTMVSVGSETGGSLIAPAALNGVVGMYPTDDLVPDEGVIPLVASTDTAGPIARSVTDAAVLLGAIDTADVDYTETLDAGALNGVTAGFFAAALSPDNPLLGLRGFEDTSDQAEKVQLIADLLAAAGAETVPAELARVDEMGPSDEMLWRVFGPNLARAGLNDISEVDDATRAELEAAYLASPITSIVVPTFFTPLVDGGIVYDMMGYLADAGAPVETLADLQAYNQEMPERRIPNGQYQVDLTVFRNASGVTSDSYGPLAEAAQQATASTLDATFEASGAEILVTMVNEHSSIYALAGYPAITVPLGLRASGGPTGVTLIGKPGTDAQLLSYAYAFEQASMLRETPDLEATFE